MVVVVFPSLPVMPITVPGQVCINISISEVKIAPLSNSLTISGVSGLQLGERKIISKPTKRCIASGPVYNSNA